MKILTLLLILLLIGCKEEVVTKKEFNYINHTPFGTAVFKLSNFKNYDISFTSNIDGETTIYNFNSEQKDLYNLM